MQRNIPFNKPYVAGHELDHIIEAINRGNISGDGHFTQNCCELLQQRLGIAKVFLTPSCTAALEMAAMLTDIGPGDEVIMPSFTFVSTANAFVRQGAKPVFVDIRPDTLNIDEKKIEAAITDRTKVICAVHYAGVACAMDQILETAGKHGLEVIEDAAQGVHAYYDGQALGSIGALGAYSFHATKNYTCGEGGALCVNRPQLIERAEIIREKGTNRSKLLRGEVDKYTWVDVGSSYVPSEIVAAFLYGQLELLDTIADHRRTIYQRYESTLASLAHRGLLTLPRVPERCRTNYHMFYILLQDGDSRDRLMGHLRDRGISAVFHYLPLHSAPMGEKFGYKVDDLLVTEDVSARLLRLPFFNDLTEADQQYVVEQIEEFFNI